MAEHNLRIQAHLDVNQLNQELDRLNQQRGGDTKDTTGNGVPLGQRLRQLQTSLDNLNKKLQGMVRSSNRASGDHLGREYSLPGMLTSRDAAKIRADRIAAIRWNADIDRQIREREGLSAAEWKAMDIRQRMNIRNHPDNADIWSQRRNTSARTSQEQNENEFRLHRRNMGFAVAGHFAGMLGQSLQDAGYQGAGAAFNVLGGVAGGAASGAVFGPGGMAIGGLIGMTSSLTSEFAKLRNATENLTKQIEKNLVGAFKSLERHETDNEMEEVRNTLRDEWADVASVENVGEVSNVRIHAISNRIEELESQLEQRRAELEAGKGETAPLSIRDKLPKNSPDWLVTSLDAMGDFIGIQFTQAGEKANEAAKEIPELVKKIDELRQRAKEWEEIGNSAEDMLDRANPYSNENHEKFVEEMLRQAEVERENEERRKQLLMEREQILLGIEQEYAQQGVDILSGMGKSGKYMSQAEAASTSQERYAPITRKLDTMQKSLDHLSQIDSKLRNLNIGLT